MGDNKEDIDPALDENVVIGDTVSEEEPKEKKFDDERSPVFESRVDKATEFWEQGKEKFREGDMKGALNLFERGCYQVDFDELSYEFELMDKHREAVEKVRIPLWLNAAACLLKEQRFKETVEYCDKVLKKESGNVKALYRRAKARENLGKQEMALADLEAAHRLAKDDGEVLKALVAMRKRVVTAQKDADAMWKGKLKVAEKEDVNEATVTSVDSSKIPWWNAFLGWFWAVVAWIASLLGLAGGEIRDAKDK
jgi:tetratricopeptide (TPR) repeat protein